MNLSPDIHKALKRAHGRCECAGECGLPHPPAVAARRCGVPDGARIMRHRKHPQFWYVMCDAAFGVPVDRAMFRAVGRQQLKPIQTPTQTLVLCKLCRIRIRKGKSSEAAARPTPSAGKMKELF